MKHITFAIVSIAALLLTALVAPCVYAEGGVNVQGQRFQERRLSDGEYQRLLKKYRQARVIQRRQEQVERQQPQQQPQRQQAKTPQVDYTMLLFVR